MSGLQDIGTTPPALVDTARRRADLHDAIIALEHAAACPASGREPAWSATVLEVLDDLEPEIVEHIDCTESPDGLYAEIAEAAPQLIHTLDDLRAEHVRMRTDVRLLIASLAGATSPSRETVDQARDDIQRLLGLLVRHRQRGAEVVWETYDLDIGDSD